MTFDYARSESAAQRLIASFGQSLTLHVISNTGPAYNPTQTETDHSLAGVVLNYDVDETGNGLVATTDRKVLISTKGATVSPSTEHKLSIGGERHSIVSVTPVNPGGTVVIWEVRARK